MTPSGAFPPPTHPVRSIGELVNDAAPEGADQEADPKGSSAPSASRRRDPLLMIFAGLLLLTALLKIGSLLNATPWLKQPNPLLPLSEGGVLVLTIAAETTVAALLLHPGRSRSEKLIGSGWILISFGLYRAAIWFFDIPRACGCLGDPNGWWPWLAQHAEQISDLILASLATLWFVAAGIATAARSHPLRNDAKST